MSNRVCLSALFLLAGLSVHIQAQTAAAPAVPDPDYGIPSWVTPTLTLDKLLPSWVEFAGEFRDRVEEFGGNAYKAQNDTHDLIQLRIRVILRPRDWLEVLGETQDAQVFFNQHIDSTPPYQNVWDIRQAFVRLGDPHGFIDVVGGRQNLTFGDERVIGPSDWVNQGRTFDVARVDLHRDWWALSLFASSVVVARDGVLDHHIQGNNLHGAYASFKDSTGKNSTGKIEPYLLWNLVPANVSLAGNLGRGALSEITGGIHAEGKVRSLLDYDIEMDRQTGSLGASSISSWAGYWHVARTLDMRFKPTPFVEANYASGTKDPSGRTWSTFDQIYPSSHDKLGFADQVGWRNIKQIRAGATQTASSKWMLHETYENFWLASARDAFYNSAGMPVVQSLAGTAGTHVGQEVDAWAEWTPNKIFEFGFGYARFLTGEYLNRLTPGKDFNYPFFYLTYHLTPLATQ